MKKWIYYALSVVASSVMLTIGVFTDDLGWIIAGSIGIGMVIGASMSVVIYDRVMKDLREDTVDDRFSRLRKRWEQLGEIDAVPQSQDEYQKAMAGLKKELETFCPFCHKRLDNGEELWGGTGGPCHVKCRDLERKKAGIA